MLYVYDPLALDHRIKELHLSQADVQRLVDFKVNEILSRVRKEQPDLAALFIFDKDPKEKKSQDPGGLISKWRSGKVIPNSLTLGALADVLEMNIEDLYRPLDSNL